MASTDVTCSDAEKLALTAKLAAIDVLIAEAEAALADIQATLEITGIFALLPLYGHIFSSQNISILGQKSLLGEF